MDLPLPPPPVAGRLVLGYSGGRDSTVLLHALRRAGYPLRAVHVHHGLQSAADGFADHCGDVCQALGVALTVVRVTVRDAGDGPEAAARRARYEAFLGQVSADELLVLAHHAQDQAETVLARMMRGTGPDGLAGMRQYDVRPPLPRWRPLLGVMPTTLAAYAEAHGLHWVEDPHNHDERYERVWLRQRILPLMRQRRPGVDAALGRLASQSASRADATVDAVRSSLAILQRSTPWGVALEGHRLSALAPGLRDAVLRAWWQQQGGPVLDAGAVARAFAEVWGAAPDRQPLLQIGGHHLRRYRGALYHDRPLSLPPPGVWAEGPAYRLQGLGTWEAQSAPATPLQAGFPTPGARMVSSGQSVSRRLSDLFQRHGVPPWWRPRVPVLRDGEAIVAVAGLAVSAEAPPGLRWRWGT